MIPQKARGLSATQMKNCELRNFGHPPREMRHGARRIGAQLVTIMQSKAFQKLSL